ncbi:MAG TPA: hypothetical protein VKT31_01090 [Solirubrobacteraceae bacterium]|nr:hypothetical protein [Solirubrobacteraceae bacterium]
MNELTLSEGAEVEPELELELVAAGAELDVVLELEVELFELDPQADTPTAAASASAAIADLLVGSCNYFSSFATQSEGRRIGAPPLGGCSSDKRVWSKP